MENNWFKLKVKYLIQVEDKIQKKTAEYVLKAVSFTDAEASLLEQLQDEFEYNLVSCSKFNIQDVRKDDAKEDYLIQGDTVEDVTKSIKQLLSGSVMDYTVENIQRTKIQEVFYNVEK